MAWRRVMCSLPPSVLRQAAAVFIMLSVSGECLQCYWCGPLAEQVHRSQRAPSCEEGARNVTACDPGYTHCAVVASSPPFVESRYCVKFYQDECYALYCSSTKTYRMTCPCRGELCNGANTQREIDAFASLSNTVAKTHNNRISKRNTIPHGLINSGKYKINNLIENDAQDETANIVDNDNTENETTNDKAMPTEQTSAGNSDNDKNNISNDMQHDEANSSMHDIKSNISESNNIGPNPSENNESESQQSETIPNEPNSMETNTNESHSTDPIVSESQVSGSNTSNPPEDDHTIHNDQAGNTKTMESNTEGDNVKQTVNEPDVTPKMDEKTPEIMSTVKITEATMAPTENMKVKEETFAKNEIKPSQLPTAEALQHSSMTTTDKPVEVTMTVTEVTTRIPIYGNKKNMSPQSTKSTKNSSEVLLFDLFALLTCLFINIIFKTH